MAIKQENLNMYLQQKLTSLLKTILLKTSLQNIQERSPSSRFLWSCSSLAESLGSEPSKN